MNCPKCVEKLEATLINTEYEMATYYDYMFGICPHCSRKYTWIEIFKYAGLEELRNVTHDPDFEDKI